MFLFLFFYIYKLQSEVSTCTRIFFQLVFLIVFRPRPRHKSIHNSKRTAEMLRKYCVLVEFCSSWSRASLRILSAKSVLGRTFSLRPASSPSNNKKQQESLQNHPSGRPQRKEGPGFSCAVPGQRRELSFHWPVPQTQVIIISLQPCSNATQDAIIVFLICSHGK